MKIKSTLLKPCSSYSPGISKRLFRNVHTSTILAVFVGAVGHLVMRRTDARSSCFYLTSHMIVDPAAFDRLGDSNASAGQVMCLCCASLYTLDSAGTARATELPSPWREKDLGYLSSHGCCVGNFYPALAHLL